MAASPWILVHPSQFPQAVLEEQCHCLRHRLVHPKFHYESHKQAQKWLRLHETYSPARSDPACSALYQSAASALARRLRPSAVHLLGLGCGGGQKDLLVVQALRQRQKEVFYTPVDVSLPLVLTAWQQMTALNPASAQTGSAAGRFPRGIVCDLAQIEDANALWQDWALPCAERIITFYGLLPNLPPSQVQACLRAWQGAGGHLLLSANLAPGPDYARGVQKVLPLYQNSLTDDWLQTWLWDLGFEPQDGTVEWQIEDCPEYTGLLRITAEYRVNRPRTVTLLGEQFVFQPGERIQLFFSYRHTPQVVNQLVAPLGFELLDQWITASQEEGVFLFQMPGNGSPSTWR